MLVINRFNAGVIGEKNMDRLVIDDRLVLSNCSFRIIGSIHHHGRTIESGHYTSNIFYTDCSFVCNDNHISNLGQLEPSNSVYLIFYHRE